MKNFAFTQVTQVNSFMLKNGEEVLFDGVIYKFDKYYYFSLGNNLEYYKINVDSISNKIGNFKQLQSDKITYYLTKFADNSQA
jgi:hypothetical protein